MKCLDSLRPALVDWELIVVANGEELREEALKLIHSLTENVKIISTPELVSPGKARNLALEEVEGEWIFFLDDDAFVREGYWERVLPLLKDHKIEVLGGPDSPVKGMNALSTALALALTSPFCTGTTFARHKASGSKLQYAGEEKLTSCNLWVRKEALDPVRFPEDFIRAEETVVLQKLKKEGKGFFYHPKLVVGHFRRTRFKQIIRPSFYAGFYRSRLMKEKLQKGNDAFWLPAVFVLLHLLIFLDPISFWYLVRMYLSVVLFISIALAMRARRFWLFPHITFLHYFIVLMYGVGFLFERTGLVKK